MTPDEIERLVVEAFVAPSRRARYFEALRNPKRRQKILNRLDHQVDDIDARFRVRIPQREQHPPEIEVLLRSKGAPDKCYVLSASDRFDRSELLLREALRGVVGYGVGTLISCIPGRLGYYESEGPGCRFILERRAG